MPTPFENTLRSVARDQARSDWVLALVGALLIGVWLLVALLVPVPVTVQSADGRVIAGAEVIDIYAPASEEIAEVAVELGEVVSAGALLLRFDTSRLELEIRAKVQRAAGLEAELVKLQTQAAAERRSAEAEQERLLSQLAQFDARIARGKTDIDYAGKAARLYGELRSERRIDALKYEEAIADLERARQDLADLRAQRRDVEAQQLLVASRSESTLAELEREIARIRGEQQALEPDIDLLEAQRQKLLVRAPVPAEIGAMAVLARGQRPLAETWLMTLVPRQAFRFQAFFPAKEGGRMRPGQSARLQLYALPWTEYGTVPARVARVASEAKEGQVKVDFDILPVPEQDPLSDQLTHGLQGTAIVNVDQATLAQRFLRLVSPLASAG